MKTIVQSIAVAVLMLAASVDVNAQSTRPAYTADQMAAAPVYTSNADRTAKQAAVDPVRDCQKYPWPGQAHDAARTWRPVAHVMTATEREVCASRSPNGIYNPTTGRETPN